MQMKLLGIISVDFIGINELLIIYSAFVGHWRKMGLQSESTSAIYRLQESLIRLGGKSTILTEFSIPIKLIRIIQIHLNETCSKVCVGKHLSDAFLFKIV
jgi:hypothetical protein